ncbi:MAG: hypothetical protein LUG44_03680 [Clostridiales bacterium]|nr:hypothetical protein [Clostridiales bacterium]
METLQVLTVGDDTILTTNYRFFMADVDSSRVTDMVTGEIYDVEDTTTDCNGQLESLTIS